jgi:methylmalonyl-CoA/ethylmalonyl-CoA epimerase
LRSTCTLSTARRHSSGTSSGLSLLFAAGKLAFFDGGGLRLTLDIAEKPEFDHPSSILYFTVPEVAAAHREMPASGVRFEDQPRMITRMLIMICG